MAMIYDLDNSGQAQILGDTSATVSSAKFQARTATVAALEIGRTVVSNFTVGQLRLNHPSTASAAVMEFRGGFVSCTSIVLTSVANFDYVIPVSLNGEHRYIPVIKAAGIVGGAAL